MEERYDVMQRKYDPIWNATCDKIAFLSTLPLHNFAAVLSLIVAFSKDFWNLQGKSAGCTWKQLDLGW